MSRQFFCEVIQKNDDIIKFQMVNADTLNDVIDILKKKYTDIKEWVIKDMVTGIRSTKKV